MWWPTIGCEGGECQQGPVPHAGLTGAGLSCSGNNQQLCGALCQNEPFCSGEYAQDPQSECHLTHLRAGPTPEAQCTAMVHPVSQATRCFFQQWHSGDTECSEIVDHCTACNANCESECPGADATCLAECASRCAQRCAGLSLLALPSSCVVVPTLS